MVLSLKKTPGLVSFLFGCSAFKLATKDRIVKFDEQVGIEPVDIANAVTFAISQPKNVDVSDIAV